MSFLGFIVQFATASFLMYSGYYFQDTPYELMGAMILGCPLILMIGAAMRHRGRNVEVHGFFGTIKRFISGYFNGIVLCVVFFAVGIGAYYIMQLSPAPGTGSY